MTKEISDLCGWLRQRANIIETDPIFCRRLDEAADALERLSDEIERLRNDIQELTCGDPRKVCPNCRDKSAAEPSGEPDEFLQFIDNWMQAYPLDIFPLPDFARVASVLKAEGLSIDQVSAANFRHVLTRMREKYAENRPAEPT